MYHLKPQKPMHGSLSNIIRIEYLSNISDVSGIYFDEMLNP